MALGSTDGLLTAAKHCVTHLNSLFVALFGMASIQAHTSVAIEMCRRTLVDPQRFSSQGESRRRLVKYLNKQLRPFQEPLKGLSKTIRKGEDL